MTRYLIIGNGIAGTSAAEEIRKLDTRGTVTILTQEVHPFYYRIRLPEVICGHLRPEQLHVKKPRWPNWYEEANVKVHYGKQVTAFDARKQAVRTACGEVYEYDMLLLANGCNCFVPPFSGVDKEGVFTLRNMQNALDIRACAKAARHAVCIGGGLLGLEAGNGLRELGLIPTVVEYFSRLLPRQLDEGGAIRLQKRMEDMGFTFVLGAQVESVTGGSDKGGDLASQPITDPITGLTAGKEHLVTAATQPKVLHLADGREYPADIVLISAGVRPNLALALEGGVKTDKGVLVDDAMRTTVPHVFAAGDVAEHAGTLYGIWTAAMQQGRVAGQNMARIASGSAPIEYTGTVMANTLKVVGIDVASAGEIDADRTFESHIHATESTYRKLVVENGVITGSVMVGNTKEFHAVTRLMQEKQPVTSEKIQTLLHAGEL